MEVGFGFVAPHGGVAETEAAVATEGEDVGGFRGFTDGLGEHYCCEAAVGEGVEFAADGVEVEKIIDIKVGGHFEDELGVVEEAVEDPVVVERMLIFGSMASGW